MPKELNFHNAYFEGTVRKALNIYERPILDTDAEILEELDCDFWFDQEDCEILIAFRNLRILGINAGAWALPSISCLSRLEELYLTGGNDGNGVDFRSFLPLARLKNLTVSGGLYSSMNLCNLEALAELKNLTNLWLHEFGKVDLKPLEKMDSLEHLFCGYADSVENVEVIGKLVHLKSLELVDFEVDNLEFLDTLPDAVCLELGGMSIHKDYDLSKLSRFEKLDMYENTVAGKWIP